MDASEDSDRAMAFTSLIFRHLSYNTGKCDPDSCVVSSWNESVILEENLPPSCAFPRLCLVTSSNLHTMRDQKLRKQYASSDS